MATKKSNKWIWIIGSLILIGGGIGVYFLTRKPKDEEDDIFIAEPDIKQEEQSQSPSKPIVRPSELDTTEKVKSFQDWMDKYRPLWINDNGKYKNIRIGTKEEPNRHMNGVGYGTYGKNTDTAWSVFGKEYLNSKSKSNSQTSNNSEDIKIITSNASGNKATKEYLSKTDPKFVKLWANAIRNKDSKNAFIFANQIYRIKTGERLLDYNPLDIVHVAKISGEILKKEPLNNSDSSFLNEKSTVGKAKGFKFSDGGLWLYFPERSTYKWGLAKYFNKNSSSSFDGVNNFEPSSSFDSFEPNI